jgi:hypothetical protein
MVLSQATVDTAAAMGQRAGEAWRDQGVPTRNPFAPQPVLAQAWRRAYFASSKPN